MNTFVAGLTRMAEEIGVETMTAFCLPRLVWIEQGRRERGISGARRLTQTEPRPDRAGLRDCTLVQALDRSLEAGLWHMAKGACLVVID
jgi:hypothetical protein